MFFIRAETNYIHDFDELFFWDHLEHYPSWPPTSHSWYQCVRYQFSYKLSKAVQLKTRVELVNYAKEESPFETGFLIYQDVIYKPKNNPFSFAFRYGLFDTDSYRVLFP